MAHRRIGQERLDFAASRGSGSLDGLSSVVDWSEIEGLVGDIYASAKGEPSWPPLALFKGLLLALWYDLSDVKLAEALDDRASFRRFCGFSSNEATPERTAFVRFRGALVARGLDEALFAAVAGQLERRGVVVKGGTLIDATVIAAAGRQDGEAAWAAHRRRAPQRGYKAHIAVDRDSGVVRRVVVTTANEADVSIAPELLPESPGEVYGDRAYDSHAVRMAIEAAGGQPRLARKGHRRLSPASLEAGNRPINRVRARVEKVFGTWKRSWGLRRIRWIGFARAALQVRIAAIGYNIKRLYRITQPNCA